MSFYLVMWLLPLTIDTLCWCWNVWDQMRDAYCIFTQPKDCFDTRALPRWALQNMSCWSRAEHRAWIAVLTLCMTLARSACMIPMTLARAQVADVENGNLPDTCIALLYTILCLLTSSTSTNPMWHCFVIPHYFLSRLLTVTASTTCKIMKSDGTHAGAGTCYWHASSGLTLKAHTVLCHTWYRSWSFVHHLTAQHLEVWQVSVYMQVVKISLTYFKRGSSMYTHCSVTHQGFVSHVTNLWFVQAFITPKHPMHFFD